MNQGPVIPALRTAADDLRVRSMRLREHSRELQQRSQVWRSWTPAAGSNGAQTQLRSHDREIQRLLAAQTDLERAIAECKSALEEVRRELRGQDPGIPLVVH
jgi:chaperonin cofactor prefoldin